MVRFFFLGIIGSCFVGLATASLTPSELQLTQTVVNFLQENGEVLDSRVGRENMAQSLALRSSFIEEVSYYSRQEDASYDGFLELFQDYVQQYVSLLHDEEKKETDTLALSTLVGPQEDIMQLQQHIRNHINGGPTISGPYTQDSSVALDMSLALPFLGEVEASLSLEAVSKVDMSRQLLDIIASVSISGSLEEVVLGEKESLALTALLDIKSIGDDILYLSVSDLNYAGSLDPQITFILDQMKDILSEYSLALPLDAERDSVDLVGGIHTLIPGQQRGEAMTKAPLIDFYVEEDGVYFGYRSISACDLLSERDLIASQECHDSRQNILTNDGGKGPLELSRRDDMSFLSRGDQSGGSLFDAGLQRNEEGLSFGIEETESSSEIQGEIRLGDGTFSASFGGEGDGNLLVEGSTINKGGRSISNWLLNFSQDTTSLGYLEFSSMSEKTPLERLMIKIPETYITLEELESLMEQRMIMYYQSLFN